MTQTSKLISPLRQRMIDDMALRKLAPKTQSNYLRAVINFTCFPGRSPDTASPEDLRRYQLRLVETGTGTSSIMPNGTITALRFFFGVTLDHAEVVARMSPVREPRKLQLRLYVEGDGCLGNQLFIIAISLIADSLNKEFPHRYISITVC